jgi:ATP synthase subunit 6
MTYSPFEQFEITVLFPVIIEKIDISITNMTLSIATSIGVSLGVMLLVSYNLMYVPNRWQSLIEIFYSFLLNLVIDQAGIKARVYYPALFGIFWFILITNLLGLTPFGFTPTGHLIVTLFLSFSFFCAWIIVGFKTQKLGFFKIFLPSNIPIWLAPLLILIEVLSFLLRPLSLAIRLFANMLAGHILLVIIASSCFIAIKVCFLLSILPIIFVLAFFLLEIGIAFLQAYVFTILLSIYLSDSLNAHK